MDLITVIVPVYNVVNELERCVRSVLSQTYSDFELLLIDDGSCDGSGNLCDKLMLEDSRIKVFHKCNGGVSSARNYGLDIATGVYVCFIDSDDWVESNYLESLLPVSGVDLVISSIKCEGDQQEIIMIQDAVRTKSGIVDNFNKLLEHMAVCSPCCKIFKRDVIEKNNIRYNMNITAGEDMLFVYDYLSTGVSCIKTISTPLYHYWIISNTSLSHKVVPLDVTLDVMDCIAVRMNKLSVVYSWDSNEVYKRLICTQLNNILRYLKTQYKVIDKIKIIRQISDNSHVLTLVSDKYYILRRMSGGFIRKVVLYLCLSLLWVVGTYRSRDNLNVS